MLWILTVPEVYLRQVRELGLIDAYPLHWLQPVHTGSLFNNSALGGPLRLWTGLVREQPVSVAAAYESAGVVGVHMVATMPQARGRGYGAALTWRATLANPRLPTVLQASDQGRPLYERMGFTTVAEMHLWERQRVPRNQQPPAR
jgi:GNAT superfamily N-acetyltransferase